MPAKNTPNLPKPQPRVVQRTVAPTKPNTTKLISCIYINPLDPETIIDAGLRLRVQRPSTPPRFNSPMPILNLDAVDDDQAPLSPLPPLTLSAASAFMVKPNMVQPESPRSPLFFSPPNTKSEAPAKPTLLQGSCVSVIKKLRSMPASTSLDLLDAEVAKLTQPSSTIANANQEKPQESKHFAGSAFAFLRKPRPPALSPVAINTSATEQETPSAPRTPHSRLAIWFSSEESKPSPCSSVELNLNTPMKSPR